MSFLWVFSFGSDGNHSLHTHTPKKKKCIISEPNQNHFTSCLVLYLWAFEWVHNLTSLIVYLTSFWLSDKGHSFCPGTRQRAHRKETQILGLVLSLSIWVSLNNSCCLLELFPLCSKRSHKFLWSTHYQLAGCCQRHPTSVFCLAHRAFWKLVNIN